MNCVFEEIQGWERPGWFAKTGPNPVPTYDWGGSYGHKRNVDSSYEKLLKQDYTFDFPVHHDIVGIKLSHGTFITQRQIQM